MEKKKPVPFKFNYKLPDKYGTKYIKEISKKPLERPPIETLVQPHTANNNNEKYEPDFDDDDDDDDDNDTTFTADTTPTTDTTVQISIDNTDDDTSIDEEPTTTDTDSFYKGKKGEYVKPKRKEYDPVTSVKKKPVDGGKLRRTKRKRTSKHHKNNHRRRHTKKRTRKGHRSLALRARSRQKH